MSLISFGKSSIVFRSRLIVPVVVPPTPGTESVSFSMPGFWIQAADEVDTVCGQITITAPPHPIGDPGGGGYLVVEIMDSATNTNVAGTGASAGQGTITIPISFSGTVLFEPGTAKTRSISVVAFNIGNPDWTSDYVIQSLAVDVVGVR